MKTLCLRGGVGLRRASVPGSDICGMESLCGQHICAENWAIIIMKVWGITDRGNVRKQNQDVFYHWTDGKNAFVIVCDGMGGALSGNIASAMAAQRFAEVAGTAQGGPQERMRLALEEANHAVWERSLNDANCRGMGTTLVCAFAREADAVVLNVGDSRCYHITQDSIHQVSRDHSLVEELVEMGQITREEARTHPHKNIITRAIGTNTSVQGDFFIEPLQPGDLLLLCSDGLSNEVSNEEMLQICQSTAPDERCNALLARAKAAGAHDNVTIVILESAPAQTM